MSSSGLSRRRVGGTTPSSTTNDIDEYQGPSASSSSPSTPKREANDNGHNSFDLSSSNSGSRTRIAYDPRDLDETGEQKLHPKLSLMDETLLLGLKDKQGYLSFWNDNISYTLRGCILIELAFRHRIAVVRDPNRRRFPLPDRVIEVVDERQTGEVLLDEALKLMKVSERMSIGTWIDLMSGETWNVMKIGYQLKQVRERLLKGLVDKGVLRTEKRNFLLFDMATHPVADAEYKASVVKRVHALLAAQTSSIPASALYEPSIRYRTLRAICLICSAFAGNVLENALNHVSYEARESAFAKCDDLLAQFGQWPFGSSGDMISNGSISSPPMSSSSSQQQSSSSRSSRVALAQGSTDTTYNNLNELTRLAQAEVSEGKEVHLEVVAGVLQVFGKMDSLL